MTRMRYRRATAISAMLGSLLPVISVVAQGLGVSVDQTIRNPAGQGIEQAAVAHATNAMVILLFWSGVIGLVTLVGVGAYGVVTAKGDEDRLEQAKGRVRLGVIGLGVLVALGLLGWFLLYR